MRAMRITGRVLVVLTMLACAALAQPAFYLKSGDRVVFTATASPISGCTRRLSRPLSGRDIPSWMSVSCTQVGVATVSPAEAADLSACGCGGMSRSTSRPW